MSTEKGREQQRDLGFFSRLKKFNTKFLLVTGLGVLISAMLNVIVARQGIHTLSEKSSREIEGGLNAATREYLTNHIEDKAQQTDYELGHAYADLEMFAAIAQGMIDRGEELATVHEAAAANPVLRDALKYNPASDWYQNGPDEPTVVLAWGYMGDKGQLTPASQQAVDRSALLDLIMPSFKAHGANELSIYYVGPREAPYSRMIPWTDLGSVIDKGSPGANQKNWYDFFFPGLTEGWNGWIREKGKLEQLKSQITVLTPYEDAAGGGMVMTVFHPLWTKDRSGFAGAVAADLTLAQLIASIKDVKLAQTGFAFLAQADGNVLAINDAGARALRLRQTSGGAKEGVGLLTRKLKDSEDPAVASIVLPQDEKVDYHEVTIDGEPHIIVLQRLSALKRV